MEGGTGARPASTSSSSPLSTGVVDSPRICFRCAKFFMFCACEGIDDGMEMSYALEPLPESASPELRMARFADCVKFHPLACRFEIDRFLADCQAGGTFTAVSEAMPRLRRMMEGYLASAAGQELWPRLGMSKATFDKMGYEALEDFEARRWSEMRELHLIMINNAFQCSDPREFPFDDVQLKKVFELLANIRIIFELCSNSINYTFDMCNA